MHSKFYNLIVSGLLLAAATVARADAPAPASVQPVVMPYLRIHDALAKDSMAGVSAAAAAIEKAAPGNKTFPSELAQQAHALALAQDLPAAREAFKPLSESIVKGLSQAKQTGSLVEVYCPMARAHWMQNGQTISNPFGSDMATCGTIVSTK